MAEWQQLSANVALLFTSNVPEHFNNLVVEALGTSEEDHEQHHFIKMFMARYLGMGRPLTGYFMICCVVEIQWTVLSQSLVSRTSATEASQYDSDLAVAANMAWLQLTQDSLPDSYETPALSECQSLEDTIRGALQLFSELLSQVEEMDMESSVDTYAWETMAESLVRALRLLDKVFVSHPTAQKLATVCSLALRNLPKNLLARLKLLLSDKSPVAENLVQEAALKSLTVLVRKSVHLLFLHFNHLTIAQVSQRSPSK
jgi:phosphatidylinositol 4-kinase